MSKVPIGSVGMFEGQLVHTNEIMVLLGDNWFAQCSAHKAVEIINHRLQGMYFVISIPRRLVILFAMKNIILFDNFSRCICVLNVGYLNGFSGITNHLFLHLFILALIHARKFVRNIKSIFVPKAYSCSLNNALEFTMLLLTSLLMHSFSLCFKWFNVLFHSTLRFCD